MQNATSIFYPPSGSTNVATTTNSTTMATATDATAIRDRHTRALLVMLMIVIGLSLGIYVGKGEV